MAIYKSKWPERAKVAILKKGVTQAKMAESIGVNKTYVSMAIRGKLIDEKVIQKISDYLGISSKY